MGAVPDSVGVLANLQSRLWTMASGPCWSGLLTWRVVSGAVGCAGLVMVVHACATCLSGRLLWLLLRDGVDFGLPQQPPQ